MYISCNPQRAQRNWIELGRPQSKQYKGDPFYPVTAVAVDMFPHTSHTEMIILFERKNDVEERTDVDRNQSTTLVDAGTTEIAADTIGET